MTCSPRNRNAFWLVALSAVLIVAAGFPGSPWAQEQAGGKQRDAVLSGQVVDALDMGVEGAAVKLFRDSFFVTETTTDIDGNYSLSFQYDPELDKTLVVWFLPQEDALVPEILVLRESFQSKDMRLLSPCLPRIDLGRQMTYNVELMDEKAKLSSLSESACFKKSN